MSLITLEYSFWQVFIFSGLWDISGLLFGSQVELNK